MFKLYLSSLKDVVIIKSQKFVWGVEYECILDLLKHLSSGRIKKFDHKEEKLFSNLWLSLLADSTPTSIQCIFTRDITYRYFTVYCLQDSSKARFDWLMSQLVCHLRALIAISSSITFKTCDCQGMISTVFLNAKIMLLKNLGCAWCF